MNWLADRWVITRYSLGLIFVGVTCLFGSKYYWKGVVAFNKDWHSQLHSIARMAK